MADAREIVYNELDRMLHALFELGRAYEREVQDDIGEVHRIINKCVSWAKAEKVVNVTVKTKTVREQDDAGCEFCKEGKVLLPDRAGDGILTTRNMIQLLFGADTDETDGGIRIENNTLYYDNSSGEYADGGKDINYCPMCGRRLVDTEHR